MGGRSNWCQGKPRRVWVQVEVEVGRGSVIPTSFAVPKSGVSARHRRRDGCSEMIRARRRGPARRNCLLILASPATRAAAQTRGRIHVYLSRICMRADTHRHKQRRALSAQRPTMRASLVGARSTFWPIALLLLHSTSSKRQKQIASGFTEETRHPRQQLHHVKTATCLAPRPRIDAAPPRCCGCLRPRLAWPIAALERA